jgi:hypothetical protein
MYIEYDISPRNLIGRIERHLAIGLFVAKVPNKIAENEMGTKNGNASTVIMVINRNNPIEKMKYENIIP